MAAAGPRRRWRGAVRPRARRRSSRGRARVGPAGRTTPCEHHAAGERAAAPGRRAPQQPAGPRPGPAVLVLDDVHTIGAAPVVEAIDYLIENRRQPHRGVRQPHGPRPVPRPPARPRPPPRALRFEELRLTEAETASLVSDVWRLSLPPETLVAVRVQTEGWPVALRLLLLSMPIGTSATRETPVPEATDRRAVFEFLAEEVLERQDPEVRRLLLETSILPELTATARRPPAGPTRPGCSKTTPPPQPVHRGVWPSRRRSGQRDVYISLPRPLRRVPAGPSAQRAGRGGAAGDPSACGPRDERSGHRRVGHLLAADCGMRRRSGSRRWGGHNWSWATSGSPSGGWPSCPTSAGRPGRGCAWCGPPTGCGRATRAPRGRSKRCCRAFAPRLMGRPVPRPDRDGYGQPHALRLSRDRAVRRASYLETATTSLTRTNARCARAWLEVFRHDWQAVGGALQAAMEIARDAREEASRQFVAQSLGAGLLFSDVGVAPFERYSREMLAQTVGTGGVVRRRRAARVRGDPCLTRPIGRGRASTRRGPRPGRPLRRIRRGPWLGWMRSSCCSD